MPHQLCCLLAAWILWSLHPLSAQSSPPVDTYRWDRDIYYHPLSADSLDDYARERCRLDVYYPADSADFATVVWFHGGGLRAGNRYVPSELQEQGIAVVAVNYRLYPKVGNPVYTEDAAAAVAWVFKNIANYGGDPGRISVSGHSAGGYLATMIGLDRDYLGHHDVAADSIEMLFPFSGHTITHFTAREEKGLEWQDVIVDEYAPLNLMRVDSPPIILITGDRDMELYGRYEEVAYFWRMLKTMGHPEVYLYELEGFHHGNMPGPAFSILLRHLRGQL